jgi:alcohol dehydrogenase
MYTYSMPTSIVFGAGALAELPAQLEAYPGTVLIVCGARAMRATGTLDRVAGLIEGAGRKVAIFDGVQPNPTLPNVRAGMQIAKDSGAQVVLGLGGGSAMDCAKGIAVGVTHPQNDVWEYLINRVQATAATLPIFAIPTTAGTGSHATWYAVTTNPDTKEKPGMGSPYIFPKVSIVDPELALSVPPAVTAATGIDVLAHCIEAYTSTARGGVADANAWMGIELAAQHLPTAVADGSNLEARTMMALADTHAGIAISNQGTSIAHTLAHAISGHYHEIPHGLALAAVYPSILATNAPACPERHVRIARALAGTDDVVAAFKEFIGRLNVCNPFVEVCPADETLEAMAEGSLDYMGGSAGLNPVTVDKDKAVELLKQSAGKSA